MSIASGLLHTGYNMFLARSYRTGDLSQVYPIARGTAPLLTFIGAWVLAGETVTARHCSASCCLSSASGSRRGPARNRSGSTA